MLINFEIFTEQMIDLHDMVVTPQNPDFDQDKATKTTREAFQSLQDEMERLIKGGMHPYKAWQSLAEGLNWHLNS